MRLNRFIAQHSTYSRRKADELIAAGRVLVNRQLAHMGSIVEEKDIVLVDGVKLDSTTPETVVILLHKPVGFVCSSDGQGSPTLYELLPKEYANLKIAGRLDKDSSGLIVITNDGKLLQELTHPSNDKEKVYIATLAKPLADGAIAQFAKGVDIGDERVSKMSVLPAQSPLSYEVAIHEGRNRQIRRSFEALGYKVEALHRIKLGQYSIGTLASKQYKIEI